MNLRTTLAGKVYYTIIKFFYETLLKDRNITPLFFTLTGLFFAVLVPLGFIISPALGGILIFMSGVSDSIDGYIARDKNQQTRFGAFLDSTIDRISDFFYLCGFWAFFWKYDFPNKTLFEVLIATSILTTLLISYTKSRIEGLGGECNKGLMSRAIRVLYLMVWCLLLGLAPAHRLTVLWIGGVIYLVLTSFTVIQRIAYALYELKDH